ncbi:MAG: hypothetical protein AAFY29_21930 [Pseudomonadota bacterium]
MTASNIDDFYYVSAELLSSLYAAFPVPHLLLVEDITGPISWDITGLPDRRSLACFETMIWLSQQGLLSYRSLEPRNVGVEGAALTQQGFVLLASSLRWDDGADSTRIDAVRDAQARLAYDDLGRIINDLIYANCQWGAPLAAQPVRRSAALTIVEAEDEPVIRA